MRRLTTTWIVFAVLATAGCVDNKGTSTDDTLPPTGQAFETNATLPGFSLQGCHGTFLGADIPEDWARPYLPDAFDPSGSLLLDGAVLDIRAVQCDRLVNGSASSEQRHMVFVTIDAMPANESWILHGIAGYVVELISDDLVLNQKARDAGIRTLDAEFKVDHLSPVAEPGFAWTIEGANFRWQFDYLGFSGDAGGTGGLFDRWYGQDEFHRVEVDEDASFAGLGSLQAVDLVAEGDTHVKAILRGAPTYPVIAQPFASFESTWRHSATYLEP